MFFSFHTLFLHAVEVHTHTYSSTLCWLWVGWCGVLTFAFPRHRHLYATLHYATDFDSGRGGIKRKSGPRRFPKVEATSISTVAGTQMADREWLSLKKLIPVSLSWWCSVCGEDSWDHVMSSELLNELCKLAKKTRWRRRWALTIPKNRKVLLISKT